MPSYLTLSPLPFILLTSNMASFLVRVSFVLIKDSDQKNIRKDRVDFMLLLLGPLPRDGKTKTQGTNLEAGSRAGAIVESYWLAQSALFQHLQPQGRGSTTLSKLGPPNQPPIKNMYPRLASRPVL